jgi:hypothetical protein
MPLEIKELHIKINVNEGGQSNASPNKKPGGKQEDLVQTCIDEIMNIQNRKKER